MVDVMALFLELLDAVIILVIKPFSLFKRSCLFGLTSICNVVQTWVELFRAAFCIHVNILWRFMILTVALLSLPFRILTALQRERLLEMQLHEMQIELENFICDRKELEARLQMATKECRMLDVMLAELEEELDQAILKIEKLEAELQGMKDKNFWLKEVQGKGLIKGQDDSSNDHGTNVTDKYEGKSRTELPDCLKTGSKTSVHIHPFMHGLISRNLAMDGVLDQQREVALSQSLFSAVLSLLVGMIIWEAEDPCMPLVVALYIVVGISLKSVVQFFSTIENKPASDAVALLSFNWFILGTLTYPTLPRVAHAFAPAALSLLEQTVCWLGFCH